MKQRITISLDEDQAAKFDQLIAERGYENRSEAFRDLIRAAEASQTLSDPPAGSQMHAHIGHEDCMEAVFLKGTVAEVRAFADKLIAEPGIRHGSINIIPAHVHRH